MQVLVLSLSLSLSLSLFFSSFSFYKCVFCVFVWLYFSSPKLIFDIWYAIKFISCLHWVIIYLYRLLKVFSFINHIYIYFLLKKQ